MTMTMETITIMGTGITTTTGTVTTTTAMTTAMTMTMTHGSADHLAIEGFTSLSFASPRPFDLRAFQNFLDNQLPESVFRAKGILWFKESERRHVFHLAGKRFSIDDSDWTGERKNQLVLIGRELEHDTLRQQLQACVCDIPE